MQYVTPFACPKCTKHVFETTAALETAMDLAESHCTNCGHELTEKEILGQAKTIPDSEIEKMLEAAAELNRPRSLD